MSRQTFLGELEHLVLVAVVRLDHAYGASVIREIEERTGRGVQAGSVYVTLDRLEKKGYLTSELDDPDPIRGGRRKRLLAMTPAGAAALAEHRESILRMWSGVEERLGT